MTTFMAMTGEGYWGKGDTVEAAKKAAKKAGSRLRVTSKQWLVKLIPEAATDAGVDGMGAIWWKFPEDFPEDKRTLPTLIERPAK